MAQGEFSLIQQYFTRPARHEINHSVLLGIGDDAAVTRLPADQLLVQTIDTLIAGRHFPLSTTAADIAYKSLAVNVSDLAAMAAIPSSFLLSLTLPEVDHSFLLEFSDSLFDAADQFGIQLIGGDTCKGPLAITIQANGLAAVDAYVTRSGAQIGDHVMLSGKVGSAALGLASLQGRVQLDHYTCQLCVEALNRPQPRVDMIPLLRQYASSAIDISDGLASDLGHILQQSRVGAVIEQSALPVIDWISQQGAYPYALAGGDDYQIVFTVSPHNYASFMGEVIMNKLDITEIGKITQKGYFLLTDDGKKDLNTYQGFNHFGE